MVAQEKVVARRSSLLGLKFLLPTAYFNLGLSGLYLAYFSLKVEDICYFSIIIFALDCLSYG